MNTRFAFAVFVTSLFGLLMARTIFAKTYRQKKLSNHAMAFCLSAMVTSITIGWIYVFRYGCYDLSELFLVFLKFVKLTHMPLGYSFNGGRLLSVFNLLVVLRSTYIFFMKTKELEADLKGTMGVSFFTIKGMFAAVLGGCLAISVGIIASSVFSFF